MVKGYEKRKGAHSPMNGSGYEAVHEVTKEVGGTESAAVTITFNGISSRADLQAAASLRIRSG